MKYLAHLENNLDSKIISIYDVIRGSNGENPIEWEGKTYYSLWYNTPMIAKINSNKLSPHFAFKKGYGGNENSGGGESIEHQLSKKIISDLKKLNIKIGQIEDTLNFSEIIIEQPFENGKYKADLFCKISNDNKFKFPINSMIVIELHSKNRVKKSKEKFYRNHNLTAIEIDIYKEIKYENDIEKLQRQLTGYFKKVRFAKRLHDPNWKELTQKTVKFEELTEKNELKSSLNYSENLILQSDNESFKDKLIEENTIDIQKTEEITKPKRKNFWNRLLQFLKI